MRTLGIDFGERRIGLALSDPAGRVAVPLDTLQRQTDRRAVYTVAEIARRENIERLVIGDPKGLDGVAGSASERVRRFGAKLAKATGLPITYIDETLTTVEAASRLHSTEGKRDGHDPRLDAIAAQILLQEALDGPLKHHPEGQ